MVKDKGKCRFRFHVAFKKCLAEKPARNAVLASHFGGVTSKTIGVWQQERGAKPSLHKAQMVADYFGYSLSEFVAMGES